MVKILTPMAKQEILDLEKNIKYLKAEHSRIRDNIYKATDKYTRKHYEIESNKIWLKIDNAEQKIDNIKRLGYSTRELTAVKKELPSGFSIKRDRDIAGTSNQVILNSKKLGKPIKVEYSRGSQFLRNVRGMASEAGKVDIHKITPLTKAKVDNIRKGLERKGGSRQITNFMGASETLRNGQKVTKRNNPFENLTWNI
jgi:hypothetical protein